MGTVIVFSIMPVLLRWNNFEESNILEFSGELLFSEVYSSSVYLHKGHYLIKFSNLSVSSINKYSEEGDFIGTGFYSETGIQGGYFLYPFKKTLFIIPMGGLFYDNRTLQVFSRFSTGIDYKNIKAGFSINSDFSDNNLFLDMFSSFEFRNILLKLFVEDFVVSNFTLEYYSFSPKFYTEVYYTLLPVVLGIIIYDRGDLGFSLKLSGDIGVKYTILSHRTLGFTHKLTITKKI